MTDDEIISELAKLPTDGYVSRVTAYRAGMMMAAEIATEREKILWDERHQANVSNPDGTYGEGLSYGAQEAADFIHRAASE